MKKIAYLIFIAILITSCVSAPTTQFVSSPSKIYSKDSIPKIYIFSPVRQQVNITSKIYQNQKFIGELGPNSYVSWDATTSSKSVEIYAFFHSIKTKSNPQTITPKTNENYYYRLRLEGVWKSKLYLEPIHESEGKALLRILHKPNIKERRRKEIILD